MRDEIRHWPELPAVKVRVGVGKRQEAGGVRRETARARATATETVVESRKVGGGNGAHPGDSRGIAFPSRSGRGGGHEAWPPPLTREQAAETAGPPVLPSQRQERVAPPPEATPPVRYRAGEDPAERRNRIGWRR